MNNGRDQETYSVGAGGNPAGAAGGGGQRWRAQRPPGPRGPAGPFASVRLSLSGISFTTFAACDTGTLPGNPAALSNVVVAFDEADEIDGIGEGPAGHPVSLEIRLDVATGLESDGAGCITGNFVADPTPAFEAELEDDLDNEEDLEFSGAIVSLGTSDFVVDVNGTQVTVLVDANTEFDNIAGLGDLAAGG